MGFDLASIFGKGVKEAVDSVGNIADKFIRTKEEKDEFNLKVQETLAKIGQEELNAYMSDMQSAREREVKVNTDPNSSWLTRNVASILALGITIGFFTMLIWMLVSDVPVSNKDILNIMIGSLGTAWVGIVGYYFGSSVGSKNNAEVIRKMVQNK